MITSSTNFTPAQINDPNTLSVFFDGGGSITGVAQWVLIQYTDLNQATLPAAVSGDPMGTIEQLTGSSFTIPSNFFGIHSFPASFSVLAAAGAKSAHTRDNGIRWCDTVSNATASAATFTIGTSTVNWTAHGLTAANSGIYFYISGGSPPTGLAVYTFYYLTNVTANTFQLSTSPNGTPITMSGTTGGTLYAYGLNRSVFDPATGTGTTLGKMNTFFATAAAYGMDVVYDCSNPPASITTGGNQTTIPTSNAFVTSWVGFLNAVFPTTAPTYWEIWNEPNTAGSFTGTITGGGNDLWAYTNWYQAVKTASQKIITPAWGTGGAAAMNTWLGTSGAAALCDILAFHPYRGGAGIYGNNTGYLGYDTSQVDAFVSVLSAYSKPMWITEVGESVPTQALLWRGHLYALGKGIARMYWYDYDLGTGIGVSPGMRVNGYPGLATQYQAMITQCAGKTCTYINRQANVDNSTTLNGGAVGANINGTAVQF